MTYGQQPPGAPGGYGAPPGAPGGYGPPPGGFRPPGPAGQLPGYGPPGGNSPPAADVVAIVSLVLGIVSIPMHFCCYLGWPIGIASIICAIIAIVRINGSQGRLTGKGFAFGGIGTSLLGFVIIIGIFVLYGAAMLAFSV